MELTNKELAKIQFKNIIFIETSERALESGKPMTEEERFKMALEIIICCKEQGLDIWRR